MTNRDRNNRRTVSWSRLCFQSFSRRIIIKDRAPQHLMDELGPKKYANYSVPPKFLYIWQILMEKLNLKLQVFDIYIMIYTGSCMIFGE